MNTLATALQTYFSVFARTQRDLSEHTIAAYRDTWRMLITFLADKTATKWAALATRDWSEYVTQRDTYKENG